MPLWVRTLLITAVQDEVRDAVRGHRSHVLELRREGRLRIAGEFPDGDGFLEIFEAADRHEAEKISRSSPLVEDGLAAPMLRPLTET